MSRSEEIRSILEARKIADQQRRVQRQAARCLDRFGFPRQMDFDSLYLMPSNRMR